MHSNGEKTKLGRIGKQELNVSSDCDVNFGVQSGIYHNEASCRRKGVDVRKFQLFEDLKDEASRNTFIEIW